jgi:HAMP domain-containing protein
MSDIDSHSYGRESPSWEVIRTSLTEMERRLGELQDQLDPRQATDVHGQPHALAGAGVTPGSGGMTMDVSATRPGSSTVGVAGAIGAGFIPPPFGSDPKARQSAEEIVAEARATAREVLAMAEAQVGLVKEQIEQLLRARESLKGSLRMALAECESSLQRLEHGEQPSQNLSPESSPGERALLQPSPGIEGSAIGVGTPFARQKIVRAAELPSVFEGSVSLRIGPLRDISQVDTLEIALLQVPGAEHVEVKEFAGRDAVAVIKLFQPVPLVEELRRVLPFQFEVAAGQPDALTLIAVEDDEIGQLNGATRSSPSVGVE